MMTHREFPQNSFHDMGFMAQLPSGFVRFFNGLAG